MPAKIAQQLVICRTCKVCRSRKVKCDGQRPECSGCRMRSHRCEYPEDGRKAAVRSKESEIQSLQSQIEQLKPQVSERSPSTGIDSCLQTRPLLLFLHSSGMYVLRDLRLAGIRQTPIFPCLSYTSALPLRATRPCMVPPVFFMMMPAVISGRVQRQAKTRSMSS
ncbi:uncharacterized protein BDZ83DRAFT_188735 [Colletotrichum acutatum]|uniref:Zn(2)-C6 fungal-type domain-containing protein n=1 Tax=Glomerella acutata TaxID=27357 RepID=A0AAD8XJU9_GLOAC|nr:uncharacterized protein BDZ83DRAFT_188735 [Colletotrichum acutatum]KAK1727770.1 hypothetical protein BDZ83DRAFT_188735 [Colletotrichum acutatum]